MQRLRIWTRGHIEVLRAWQHQGSKLSADWPRLTALYRHLKTLPLAQQTQWRRRCKATLWGVALCLAASGAQLVHADTITVDGSCTLVDAITAANTDTATGACAAGSGADTIELTVDTTLTTSNNSTFGYTGLPVVSSVITIAGNGKKIERTGGPTFRLLAINSAGNLTLQDTTVSGGVAAGTFPSNRGGGILNRYGQLRLEGCTVTGNSADSEGGGVGSATNGSDMVSLLNSTVSGNSADGVGGGVFSYTADSSTLSLLNSTVSGNMAGNYGGGVHSITYDSSTVSLVNSTVSGNSAADSNGGGGHSRPHDSSTLSLVNTTVSGNSARVKGGGVFSRPHFRSGEEVKLVNTTVSLVNTTVSGNSVGDFGGGVFIGTYGTSTLSLVNSTLSGNWAINGGGGYIPAFNSSTVSLVNSTVSGNSAANYGGGVYSRTFDSGTVRLVNTTVSGNSAGYAGGGGVHSRTFETSTVALHHSLIAGNTAIGSGDEVWQFTGGGSFLVDEANLFGHDGVSTADALDGVTAGTSDILATSDGTDATDLPEILATTLADNGGPTLTHNLVTGSSAIDAAGACGLATDQRGFVRNVGDCDIGAVEFGATIPAVCGNSMVESGEDCDLGASNGTAGVCCSATCDYETNTHTCRPAAGACDVAETCSGSSDTCGSDVLQSNGIQCAPAGADATCDPADTCDGVSAACPTTVAPVDTPCGSANNTGCDAPDSCDAAGSCVAQVDTAGTVCRPSTGSCDPQETCDGSSATCPTDASQTSGCTVNGVPNQPCVGTAGNDNITGTIGDDVIRGGGGSDTLRGDSGNDTICGEAGKDFVYGGAGDDTLFGGSENDAMRGEAGNDTLRGEGGKDTLFGGNDADTLDGGTENDSLKGDSGDDALDGGAGTDSLNGGIGTDTCVNGETLTSCP